MRLLFLLLLLFPGLVGAQERSAAQIAEWAAMTHETWCSDVASATSTQSFEASAAVSSVLAEVSRTYDRQPEPWLLYWRGLLAICAEREERGISDLHRFLEQAENDSALAPQVADARRRLTRLQAGVVEVDAEDNRPAIGVGIGLLAGGGVFAGLSGWQGSEAARHQAAFASEELPWDDRVEQYAAPGEQAAAAANGLLGAAIGAGAGGAAALVVAGVLGATPKVAGAPTDLGVAVAPTDGGVVVTIGGRW